MDSPQSSTDSCPDWRSHFQSGVRRRIVLQIMFSLATFSGGSFLGRSIHGFQEIGARLEANAYSSAANEQEYVELICCNLVRLWMRTLNRRNPNSQHHETGSSNRTGTINAVDWQVVAYEKIQQLKTQHYMELKDIYQGLRWNFAELGGALMQGWPGLKFLVKIKLHISTIYHILKDLKLEKSSIDSLLAERTPLYQERLPVYILRHRSLLARLATVKPRIAPPNQQRNN